jgi:hypothetical protein
MSDRTAITVFRAEAEVRRLWHELGPPVGGDVEVDFKDAPADRGTEIHVGSSSPEVRDALRRFKARVETGRVPVSEATPEGERFARKLKQRPAQPLSDRELQEVGLR